ncbi:protein-tyrosine phosphatase [Peribacillus deserti]|uniref:Tyrosine-protein phosphatase n=1 Tax=Peribacillus deserti TaxID=673318 RepID=A0ABS2QC71_9BACI|nr:CpsB/CapC family capsule biosynthesis tyrosine phosphatase [Peribacillus deserti]MBM7690768.1 protein-tyrosine phosphatase [Peribacillus deserti]
MIDIHCHILPGVDDGPESNYKSIDLARVAVQQGIHTIVATPHHIPGSYTNTREEIIRKVNSFNEQLKSEKISLTVLPGQEPRISGTLMEQLEQGDILTLNDKQSSLLIEFPKDHVPKYTEKLFYDLLLKGISPIIVHPEQNLEILENPEVLYQLIKRGAYAQVDAESVAGKIGRKAKKFSLELIKAKQVQFIGSNAHNTTKRSFKMEQALKELKKGFGNDMIDMFMVNAEKAISGEPVFKEEPDRVKKVKTFALFK